jgi:hypothetical protein
VKNLAKDGNLARYKAGLWQWTWTNGRESSISYEVRPGQGIRLHYKSNGKPFDYLVRVVTTPCNYGGVRYWWLCPHCGRRCRILYCHGLFVCRQCSGAYYETQASKDLLVRIDNELRRLCRQLGVSLSINNIPNRPKRMHWRKYMRLTKRIPDLQYYRVLSIGIDIAKMGEAMGIRTPGSADDMKEQLRWLMGDKEIPDD